MILAIPRLAERLGQTCHLSPLLRKLEAAAQGEELSSCLMEAAVRRGAKHYQNTYDPPTRYPAQFDRLANEELGIALCLAELPYDPLNIRVASDVLSAPGNELGKIILLARQERCELIVRHIAECGHRVEPDNPAWGRILSELEARDFRNTDFLPGWTRFVSMTGFTRTGGKHVEWLRIHAPGN